MREEKVHRGVMAVVSMGAALAGLSLSVLAAEQTTIFNTKDFHKDKALWTSTAYYRNNTPGELVGMALNIVPYQRSGQIGAARLYGSQGTGKAGATNLASPYPFKTAVEHYQAWLKDAKGGTKHTKATIPDWSGIWNPGGGDEGGKGPASDTVRFLTPKYQEYYVQQLKAASEARIWTPQSMCLPRGFFGFLEVQEFIIATNKVWMLSSTNTENTVRWIYTDGSGHAPDQFLFPKWNGSSISFWNGDSLIVHTNQIKGWKGGPGGEFSDKLETVEKYRRVGDRIDGEMTLYDPEVFIGPAFERLSFSLSKDTKPEDRPIYNSCSDTNGPSPAVYLDEKGFLNERVPGEAGYTWDPNDPRPWGTALTESDRRYRAYLAAGGKAPVQSDQTPSKQGAGKR
jgi:hypothetical protein